MESKPTLLNPNNKIAFINGKVFQEYTYLAYQKFKTFVEDGNHQTFCEHIYNNWQKPADALGDYAQLENAYQKLKKNGYDLLTL